jgi:hypothetical protein
MSWPDDKSMAGWKEAIQAESKSNDDAKGDEPKKAP